MDAKLIRRQVRQQRRELTNYAFDRAAEGVFERLVELPELQAAKKVVVYQSHDGELSLVPVVRWLWQHGQETLLPIINPEVAYGSAEAEVTQADEAHEAMRFGRYDRETRFIPNRYGIPEPEVPEADQLLAKDIDVVLAPVVAFDQIGNRIGMGGGYYDRTFAFRKQEKTAPLLVGVAYAFQQVDSLSPEAWDVPLDVMVTDQDSWRFDR